MQNLTVLWLDDQRNPLTYFKKKDEKGEGTLHDNLVFYANLSQRYNLSFVWVKNYKEFVNYIEKNGMPEFISFDHDLSKTSLPTDPKGLDCAKWLVNYCAENGIKMPMTYVHSANPKWRGVIRNILNGTVNEERKGKKIRITEEQFKSILTQMVTEGVYINGINGKKANLTYKKGSNYNKGNLVAADNLKTDRMDSAGHDTYEVNLKGGIKSYNITSINGTAVMHYFKKYFDHQKAEVSIKNKKGVEKTYEIEMLQNEFRDFMSQFVTKVEYVIKYVLGNSNTKVNAISIYPVPSSSNFNEKMAEELSRMSVNGLPVQIINKDLLVKDLRNIQRDQEFIDKNKDYYNGLLSNTGTLQQPIIQHVDKTINKYRSILPAEKNIDAMNDAVEKILHQVSNIRTAIKNGRDCSRMVANLVTNYKRYYDNYAAIEKIAYINPTSKKGQTKAGVSDIASIKPYSKGPSIENRTNYVWNIVKQQITHNKIMDVCPITRKRYEKLPLQYWDKNMFQIKDLSNPERMALKNIYNPNMDPNLVQQELQKIKGTAFVIFDDNISGGATLSDICYQCKQMGIENIIPITFGQMDEKWTYGIMPLNRPQGGFNYNQE